MTDHPIKRRLTAILSADVKGYSRLMGADEVGTVQRLSRFREMMTDMIGRQGGRVVDSPGDNLLAEFGSVVAALECAAKIQGTLETENAQLSDDRKMRFRIGINLGEVIEDGQRIYGDGVNVAARIEGLADPGGICIARNAYDQVKNRVSFGFEYLGERTVKNIAEPVRVYKVLLDPERSGMRIKTSRVHREKKRLGAALAVILLLVIALGWKFYAGRSSIGHEKASIESMAFHLPKVPSVAVMPFDNLSADPNQDYLGDGLAENIITNLSKIPSIFVIARRSTFAYKHKPATAREVSEDLGVRYILEGSLQKSGDRVRLNTQLIDALSGRTLWADGYDRKLTDIFQLQDEITQKVITVLEVKLTEGEQARYRRGQTKNPDAYDFYARGLDHYRRFTAQDNQEALRLFEKAVEQDPNFLHAKADIGWAELNNWRFRWGDEPKRSLTHAQDLAIEILDADEGHSTANALLGTIFRYKGDFEKAITYGMKSVETEPNGSDVIATLATTLMYAGRASHSLELIQRAMRLSPKHPDWFLFTLGAAHRQLGNYQGAIAAHESWQNATPHSPNPYLTLVYTYTLAGRLEDARNAAKEFLRKRPNFSVNKWEKRAGYADPNEVSRISRAMIDAGLPK